MRRPISVAMIPITTSSSINVKALQRAGLADMTGALPLSPHDARPGETVVCMEPPRFPEFDRSGETSFWGDQNVVFRL
jgi:hypothetical protein